MNIITNLKSEYNSSDTFKGILNNILSFMDIKCKKCDNVAIKTKETGNNLCKECYEDERDAYEYYKWKYNF